MKRLIIVLVTVLLFYPMNNSVSAQITNPLDHAKEESEEKVNDAIDNSLDRLEEGIGSIFNRNRNKSREPDKTETEAQPSQQSTESPPSVNPDNPEPTEEENPAPVMIWSKYDFIPGDEVIFEDNLLGEENGEFPSRWDLSHGNVEITEFDGENVITFFSGSSCIIPYITNPDQDYLPDVFTIEFDAYYDVEPHSAKYIVRLYDVKNQKTINHSSLNLLPGGLEGNYSTKTLEGKSLWENTDKPFWRHIAIGFNVRALKVYYDDERMMNVPNVDFNPTGLSISIINTVPVNFFIKNIRIAKGGQKLYDKFLQDGKIITNGIRFDFNRATLKPESMGVINEIVELMEENPDINFSVEGHTDSDGDESTNQSLSEQRAQTVVGTMVNMGVDEKRLSSKGWGESKPLNANATPEGKANNRRVEFVKFE